MLWWYGASHHIFVSMGDDAKVNVHRQDERLMCNVVESVATVCCFPDVS